MTSHTSTLPHNGLRCMLAFTLQKEVLLYVERWLKTGVEQEDGSITVRTRGTPQGGVISPLLANIYLHHGFDKWMEAINPQNPFERYADDIVIHCNSKAAAEDLLGKLKSRMSDYGLELHPEKTKVVYCKNYHRNEKQDNNSFTFLSYSFQPRTIKSQRNIGERFVVFMGGICNAAKTHIKQEMRRVLVTQWSNMTLEWFAERLNPKIRGWMNYYSLYSNNETQQMFYYLNTLIRSWIKNKHRVAGKAGLYNKYRAIQQANPEMFYHWRKRIIT
ncbi:MAG: reverse transcriptase domain-containing protein [Taibaiella sp.]